MDPTLMLLTHLEQGSPHHIWQGPASTAHPLLHFPPVPTWAQLGLEGSTKGILKVTICRGSEGQSSEIFLLPLHVLLLLLFNT